MILIAINKFQDFKGGIIFGLITSLIILAVTYLFKKYSKGKN